MKQTNEAKERVQFEALDMWHKTGRCGTIAAGTGFGKSRLAVMEVIKMASQNSFNGSEPEVLLVSPTEKLRDVNWPQEFEDWGASDLFNRHVKSICFASLRKERDLLMTTGKRYKLVILDEIHHLTMLNAEAFSTDGFEEDDILTDFFAAGLTDAVIGLTATEPDPNRDPNKARIIYQIAPVVFRYSLDRGVSDGLIADYEIRVIWSPLDDSKKVIPGGTKLKPFKVTEAGHYKYIQKSIQRSQIGISEAFKSMNDGSIDVFTDMGALEKVQKKINALKKQSERMVFARTRFIYNLATKTEVAVRALRFIAGQGKRTLVFCGSIAQSDYLLPGKTYHSKSGDAAFNAFNAKHIDILGVVNAANEGINFTELDQALILQVDSNARNLVQRIGRCLRVRDGHKAIIYIVCAPDTVDQKWLAISLEGFDPNKITYYDSKAIP